MMNRQTYGVLIAVVAVLVPAVYASCVMSQLPGQIPTRTLQEPFPYTTTTGEAFACPEFQGGEVCCNAFQNTQLLKQFKNVDNAFGVLQIGGCPICANNMKKLWCAFTCSPKQDTFVVTGTNGTIVKERRPYPVLFVNITLHPQMGCEMWESCKKTNFASLIPNAAAFFVTQTDGAIDAGNEKITIFWDKEKGFNTPITPCNKPGADGKVVCGPNSCAAVSDISDDPIKTIPSVHTMEGFNYVAVSIFYGVLVVLTGIISFAKSRLE
eukprot:GILI01010257.1.p2 GENE.GILI01010257.1~~GILI01010257.1.p2  ORF type:complete len:287 (-),score=101.01 GILI01010257.1:305-1105(-)